MDEGSKSLREIGCIFKVEATGFAEEIDIECEKMNQGQFKDLLVINGEYGIPIFSPTRGFDLWGDFSVGNVKTSTI